MHTRKNEKFTKPQVAAICVILVAMVWAFLPERPLTEPQKPKPRPVLTLSREAGMALTVGTTGGLVPTTGTQAPAWHYGGGAWDVLDPQGRKVGWDDASGGGHITNGWAASWSPPATNIQINVPANAINGVGYTVRFWSDETGSAVSGTFDVVGGSAGPVTIPKNATTFVPQTHCESPANNTGYGCWDIARASDNVVLGYSDGYSSGNENGWGFSMVSGGFNVTVPAGAADGVYKVRSDVGSGGGGVSGMFTLGTAAAAPTTPTSFNSTLSTSPLEIALTWTAGTDTTGYELYRSVNGGTSTLLASPTGTSYTDSAISAGNTYAYKVRATGPGGTSAFTAEQSETVPAEEPDPIPSPTGLVLQALLDPIRILVDWNEVVAATQYQIYRAVNGGTSVLIDTASVTFYTDTDVEEGVTYAYAIVATDGTTSSEPAQSTLTFPSSNPGGSTTMERPSNGEGLLVGVEVTPGVEVARTKKLVSVNAETLPVLNVTTHRPTGTKGAVAALVGKEWSETKLTGVIDFNALTYIFASLFGPTTPATQGTLGKKWTFLVSTDDCEDPQTYSTEIGGCAGGSKFAYGVVTDATFRASKEDASWEGSMVGRKLTDGITMTTTGVTEVTPVVAPPKSTGVYVGTDGSTWVKAAKLIDLEFGFNERWKAVIYVDDEQDSFNDLVEPAPAFTAKITAGVNTQTATFLDSLRNGTPYFLQLRYKGPLIESTPAPLYYSLTITMPVFFTKPDNRGDYDGVRGESFTAEVARDSAFGLAKVEIVNKLATL